MLPITPDELRRWRAEIELGVEHREKEFGTYAAQQACAKNMFPVCNINFHW